MSFDTTRWREPATRSELADACIATTLALRSLILAIQANQTQDAQEVIKQLRVAGKHADELSGMFDNLAGYTRTPADDE